MLRKIKFLINKPFFLLSVIYLATRLINLLKLPIFNDESIYIDWGFKEINGKGLAFYSLFDGKPPFLMWVFGIFHKFISDPLFAGRFVSVITGFLTLFGIYKLSKRYFGKKVATLAGIYYTIIPLFVFFDRQALMESAVTMIGVWSLYYFLDFIGKPGIKNAIILGVIWGLGIFIKQSVLVFFLAEAIIYIFLHITKRGYKFSPNLFLSLAVSQLVLTPLYFQKNFWAAASSGSRFMMDFRQILSFPISAWIQNLKGIFMIPFWYLFLPIFLLTIVGSLSCKESRQRIILAFYILSIALILIFSINVSPRYLVAFLFPITILAAHGFDQLKIKKILLEKILFIVSIIIPASLSVVLLLNPPSYFYLLNKVTSYSQESEYVTNWTSGYATTQTISFIHKVSEKTPVVVGVRVDAGNPESAVFAYFNGSKKVFPLYFDSRLTTQEIFSFDCLSTNIPFYFVARDDILAGMDKFLIKVAVFRNPIGDRFVGVYTLKNDCKENVLNITF